jgi:site-specific recombinase XerD
VLIATAGDRAQLRFLEFFALNVCNPHMRRAYAHSASEFLAWCAEKGIASISAVQPLHVATWIEAQTRALSPPSVKQRLAALRHLFDWLVTSQAVLTNPAASVRGPSHVVKSGNHSFRATGITAYLKNGGSLEKAAAMANHASTRTTQLYDRRRDEMTLDDGGVSTRPIHSKFVLPLIHPKPLSSFFSAPSGGVSSLRIASKVLHLGI